MVLPALILLKPSEKLKARDYLLLVECHLNLWLNGRLLHLLNEGRTIQNSLKSSFSSTFREYKLKKQLSKLMWERNVKIVIKLLADRPLWAHLLWTDCPHVQR